MRELTVLTGHQATGIVWSEGADGSNLATASGVKFVVTPASPPLVSPEEFTVGVSGEVIVSAGAIGVGAITTYMRVSG